MSHRAAALGVLVWALAATPAWASDGSATPPPTGGPETGQAAASASPAPDAAPAPTGKTLTLSQAVDLAVRNNPDFRAADWDVRSAKGALTQSALPDNPDVFVASNGAPTLGKPVNQYGVDWTIPFPLRYAAGIKAAKSALQATKEDREEERRTLVLAVQTAFVNVQLARAQLHVARQERDAFKKSLKLNELRYKDGKIAYGDVLKLRVQELTEDDAVMEATEGLDTARADLRQVVGGNEALSGDFTLVGTLEPPPPSSTPPDEEALVQSALAHRPDYLSLLAQRKSAKATRAQVRMSALPDFGLSADVNTAQGGSNNYDASLDVVIPLFDQGIAASSQANADFQKADLAITSLEVQVRADVTKALAEWKTSRALVAAYQGGTRDAARESLQIARHSYEVGNGSLLDYLDAESSYREVESAWQAALARATLADFTLDFVSGKDLQ